MNVPHFWSLLAVFIDYRNYAPVYMYYIDTWSAIDGILIVSMQNMITWDKMNQS